MKLLTLFLTIIFIFSIDNSIAQDQKPSRGPIMTFETQVYDFGNIGQSRPRNEEGKCEFVFINTGDEPLIITGVRASCGCTAPSYTQDPVLPGETGTVTVQYDNSRAGRFSKIITVTSNAEPSTVRLTIRGNVVPAGEATPVNPTGPGTPTAR